VPSFAVSISVLALVQAALVAAPRGGVVRVPQRLRGRAWAAVPAASIVVVIFGLRAASQAAQGITYVALICVPPLAALALGAIVRGARAAYALLAIGLFALAWADRGALAGETAALALSALSCVTLGAVLAAVAPAPWLKVGIVAMALVDVALVTSDLLQTPNAVLNAAAPGFSLPRLQDVTFGSAVMGYGDLFIAGLLGGVLARERATAMWAALLTAVIGLLFNLLFFAVDELPATVPVALAMLVLEAQGRRRLAAARAVG
jgi:hypothetical protein